MFLYAFLSLNANFLDTDKVMKGWSSPTQKFEKIYLNSQMEYQLINFQVCLFVHIEKTASQALF